MKHGIKEVFSVGSLKDVPPEPEMKVVASIGRHETIYPKDYEFIMHVCYEVKNHDRSRDLNAEIVNPSLRKFRRQLENYKFKEDGITAWTVRVDEFEGDSVNENRLVCSQQILWRAHSDNGFSCDSIKARLLRDMLAQRLENKDMKISIQMTDALYDGSSKKQSRWPRNEYGKEQMF